MVIRDGAARRAGGRGGAHGQGRPLHRHADRQPVTGGETTAGRVGNPIRQAR